MPLQQEGPVYSEEDMLGRISGGAATRLRNSLKKDSGPTVSLFHCPRCQRHHFLIDQP